MEESPEQVLARLVRYRDSLNLAAGPRAGAWGAPARAEADLLPARARVVTHPGEHAWRPVAGTVPATLFGQILAVLACAAAVLAFEQFAAGVAVGCVAAATAIGVIAAARRVPLALWWTFGVVIGGVLGRWS